MHRRNTRVLWLLNHKTLMPYEVPLLRRLGYEVFIPKIIPAKNFRSATVDFGFDAALTIPPDALAALNAFNLYEDEWTPQITRIVNRYFGAAFTMLHTRLVTEVVDKFEGQIVLRAFGLPNGASYTDLLRDLNGPVLLRKLANMGDRFWFGEGYDNLHEVEGPLLRERAIHLPIGIPDSFFATAHRWTGSDRRILFVCPDIRTDEYHGRIYREFKEQFGDLPHVIAGIQREPVDDPHVVGFVTDDELTRLYLECSVLYYHSREERHVHYPPIEAAINGMPVVFYEGSLLDRMSSGTTLGRVSSAAEARRMIERILAGDDQLIGELTASQRSLPDRFTDPYCSRTWADNLASSGFEGALRRGAQRVILDEARRFLLAPWARGKTSLSPHRAALQTPGATHTEADAIAQFGGSLLDGIDFADRSLPDFVHYIEGIGAAEPWGRWSNSDAITLVLKYPLEGEFRLFLRGGAYGDNIDVPVPVTIGSTTVHARLGADTQDGVWLHFRLETASNTIRIGVPHPTGAKSDPRVIGIGLSELRIAPPVTRSMRDAELATGTSLARGIDFSDPAPSPVLVSSEGLGDHEGWGRWSVAHTVRLELSHVLEGDLDLIVLGVGYGDNAGAAIPVSIGGQVAQLILPAWLDPDHEPSVRFTGLAPSNVLTIGVPHPVMPEGDNRTLGVGLFALRAVTLPTAAGAREAGVSLDDGIDFASAELTPAVHSADGLAGAEDWGRWSLGGTTRLRLNHTLEGEVSLLLRAIGYGRNTGADVVVTLGAQSRTVRVPAELAGDGELRLDFDLPSPASVIEFTIPAPTAPPGDAREIGIGFVSLRSASRLAAE